ncbi:type IX secretion system protein PorD [Wenyingzhuangia sp. IMCC45574]
MYKQFLFFLMTLVFTIVKAQELDCNITVNGDQIAVSNNRIFKTMENSLTEFLNQQKWTNVEFKEHERIKCSFTLLLTEQSGPNTFKGSLQVQASRPVFNSTYYSPIFNYKDDNFTINYVEFQPLNYNPNGYESNLISVLSYYSYFILGLYVDSFSLKGGDEHFTTALTIANQAQQSGFNGWSNSRLDINRFTLVDKFLLQDNDRFREVFFKYHFDCMDAFERNQRRAVTNILRTLKPLKDIYDENPNSISIRIFTDAKSDELVNIFRKNRGVDASELVSILRRVAPNNSKKWKQIYTN